MIDDVDDESLYADSPELEDEGEVLPAAVKPKRRAIDGPLRHTFRVIRDGYRDRCAALGLPCGICGKSIDYRLSHRDPWAFELDHVIAVEDDPNLALAEKNFQPSHSRCNKRKAILQAMEREAGGAGAGGVVDEWDESLWPTAVVDGITIRYHPDLGIPSEVW